MSVDYNPFGDLRTHQLQLLLYDKNSLAIDVNSSTVKAIDITTGSIEGVGTENAGTDNPKYFMDFELHNITGNQVSPEFESSTFNTTDAVYDPKADIYRFVEFRSRQLTGVRSELVQVVGTGTDTYTVSVYGLSINDIYSVKSTGADIPFIDSFVAATGSVTFERNLAVGEVVQVSYDLYDPTLDTDWNTIFFGQIIDPQLLKSGLRVRAQDLSLRLEKKISVRQNYGSDAGTKDAEDVIRDILDAEGYVSVVLNTPVASSFNINEYYLENTTVWAAIQNIAKLSAHYLYSKINSVSGDPELYFEQISRTETADYDVSDSHIIGVPTFKQINRDVRNKIIIGYYDTDNEYQEETAEDTTSINLHKNSYLMGNGEMLMKWTADKLSGIKNSTQAQAIADDLLADLKDPYWQIQLPLQYNQNMIPGIKLDLTSAYYFDSNVQFMMIDSVRHSFRLTNQGIKGYTTVSGNSKVLRRKRTNFTWDSEGTNKPDKPTKIASTATPPAPLNLVLTPIVEGIRVDFDKITAQGNDIRNYRYYIKDGAEPTIGVDPSSDDAANEKVLSNLDPAKTYHVAVTAINVSGIEGLPVRSSATPRNIRSGNITWYQSDEPEISDDPLAGVAIVNDYWVDADTGYQYIASSAGSDGWGTLEWGENWGSNDFWWRLIAEDGDALAIANAALALAEEANNRIISYYQNSAPALPGDPLKEGDIWFDTDDGNKPYRWTGSAWVDAQDDLIVTAIDDAQTAQTTADGKAVTFYEDVVDRPTVTADPETGANIGDLWIATDDDRKLYRADATGGAVIGVNWLLIQDSETARNLASNKAETFYSDIEPTVTSVDLDGNASLGDLWINTANGNELYRAVFLNTDILGWGNDEWGNDSWGSAVWQPVQDQAITTAQDTADSALDDATTAQNTADAKARCTRSATAPTSPDIDDIWIDTANNQQMKLWTGSAWVVDQDSAYALATADGKNTQFYQTGAPIAIKAGDIWVDIDDGNLTYVWSGSAWEQTTTSIQNIIGRVFYVRNSLDFSNLTTLMGASQTYLLDNSVNKIVFENSGSEYIYTGSTIQQQLREITFEGQNTKLKSTNTFIEILRPSADTSEVYDYIEINKLICEIVNVDPFIEIISSSYQKLKRIDCSITGTTFDITGPKDILFTTSILNENEITNYFCKNRTVLGDSLTNSINVKVENAAFSMDGMDAGTVVSNLKLINSILSITKPVNNITINSCYQYIDDNAEFDIDSFLFIVSSITPKSKVLKFTDCSVDDQSTRTQDYYFANTVAAPGAKGADYVNITTVTIDGNASRTSVNYNDSEYTNVTVTASNII